jgi:hypothetical protein
MRTTKLQNLPQPAMDRSDSDKVKGGLNPQPLPPRWARVISLPVLRPRGF